MWGFHETDRQGMSVFKWADEWCEGICDILHVKPDISLCMCSVSVPLQSNGFLSSSFSSFKDGKAQLVYECLLKSLLESKVIIFDFTQRRFLDKPRKFITLSPLNSLISQRATLLPLTSHRRAFKLSVCIYFISEDWRWSLCFQRCVTKKHTINNIFMNK